MNTATEQALNEYLEVHEFEPGPKFGFIYDDESSYVLDAFEFLIGQYKSDKSNRQDIVDFMIFLLKKYDGIGLTLQYGTLVDNYGRCIIDHVENDDIERILVGLPNLADNILFYINEDYENNKRDFSTNSDWLVNEFLEILITRSYTEHLNVFEHEKEMIWNCTRSIRKDDTWREILPKLIVELISRGYYDVIEDLTNRRLLSLYCDFVCCRSLLEDAAGRKAVPGYIFKGPYANAKINDRAGYTGTFLLHEENILKNFRNAVHLTLDPGIQYPIRELNYVASKDFEDIRIINQEHPTILEVIDNQKRWIAEQMDRIVNPDRNVGVFYKRILNWQLSI